MQVFFPYVMSSIQRVMLSTVLPGITSSEMYKSNVCIDLSPYKTPDPLSMETIFFHVLTSDIQTLVRCIFDVVIPYNLV